MSDIPEVKMQFNGPVTSAAGNVQGDFVVNPNPKPSIKAADEIKKLLKPLQQSNPTDLEDAIQRETLRNPTFKVRLRNALKEAGLETAKVLFAPLGIGIEAVRGWIEAE